jgi:hypothetical protein
MKKTKKNVCPKKMLNFMLYSIIPLLFSYIFKAKYKTRTDDPLSLLDPASEIFQKCIGVEGFSELHENYNYCESSFPSLYPNVSLNDDKLIQLHIIHRHGDRSPNSLLYHEDQDWDKCDHPQENFFIQNGPLFSRVVDISVSASQSPIHGDGMWKGNCNLGQLTQKGHRQMEQLGDILGKRYWKPVSVWGKAPVTLGEFHIQSTDGK